jgi:uncharacterized protein (DUF1684 family)
MSSPFEELADYRRRVTAMYAAVRESRDEPGKMCRRFRATRDELFRTHPQSALGPEAQVRFTGLRYFDYDPAYRFVLPVDTDVEPRTLEMDVQDDGLVRLRRFGQVHFNFGGQAVSLSLYWIMGYGGGIFLPFRDATNNHETYGGGRYVLDTIKGADLGQADGKIVVDFNYAYNPSCAYDERWVCPLAPVENRLRTRVEAGEMKYINRG